MSITDTIGFGLTILAAGLGFALIGFLACFGGVMLHRQWLRGVELTDRDQRTGQQMNRDLRDVTEFEGRL